MGLAMTPGADVIDPLLSALKDPDAQVREKAAIGLAFRRDPKIIDPLLTAMEDSDSQVREKAAIALGASGDARAVGALTKAMKDPDSQVREKAVAGLVLLGTAQMILAAALAAQVTLALSPCKIEGVPGEAKCGAHTVWEDRDAPLGGRGRIVGLSVIVLSALEADKLPDPFFMLAGGPGDAPSFNARFFSRVFHDIRRTRDIVLVDLRGTGKSSPLALPGARPAGQRTASTMRTC